jgi:diguanylate cyclase (GGDEF)-like protein
MANEDDEIKVLNLDAADYISKPFHPDIVRLRVRNRIKVVNHMRDILRLSLIDQLTHIPNRRSFDGRMRVDWGRAIRGKSPISLLMIDIDHFKKFNDFHGHLQGDVLLHNIAKVFTSTLKRAMDFVARWGGEEFAAILTDTDENTAMTMAEILRTNVEKTPIQLDNGKTVYITVSIGVNTETPVPSSSLQGFIGAADSALYRAKHEGRNRVCMAE